jgi:DUF438 domain-containing protein
MNVISGTVIGTINKYDSDSNSINSGTIDHFIEEFSAAGSALSDKIQKEESVLYPLYEEYGASHKKSA